MQADMNAETGRNVWLAEDTKKAICNFLKAILYLLNPETRVVYMNSFRKPICAPPLSFRSREVHWTAVNEVYSRRLRISQSVELTTLELRVQHCGRAGVPIHGDKRGGFKPP